MAQKVKAQLKFLRMSARKVRLILNLIKGMDAEDALDQLAFSNKRASEPIAKLLKSAIANAEHNYKMSRHKLRVAIAKADQGPTVKRSMPRAHGSASPIRKRSAHVTIMVEEKR